MGPSIKDRIENDFKFHPASTEEKQNAHSSVRNHLKSTALYVEFNTPAGREQSLALTKLEEAMFWANAAIARAGSNE